MKYVFISYSRDDADFVGIIKTVCDHFNVSVWVDTGSISGGTLWRDSIDDGIRDCSAFIACLSKNYGANRESYIVDELRAGLKKLATADRKDFCFVPIKLENYDVQEGQRLLLEPLHNLHIIDFTKTGLNPGLQELFGVLLPIIKPDIHWFHQLQKRLTDYVNHKVQHFTAARTPRFSQIEDAWRSLAEESLVKALSSTFIAGMEKANLTGRQQTEWLLQDTKVVLLTYIPSFDTDKFKDSLIVKGHDLSDKYLQCILEATRTFRATSGWEKRDFVHVLYFSDGSDWILDLLYIENFELTIMIYDHFASSGEHAGREAGQKTAITYEALYPTYLTNAIDYTAFSRMWLQECQTLYWADS